MDVPGRRAQENHRAAPPHARVGSGLPVHRQPHGLLPTPARPGVLDDGAWAGPEVSAGDAAGEAPVSSTVSRRDPHGATAAAHGDADPGAAATDDLQSLPGRSNCSASRQRGFPWRAPGVERSRGPGTRTDGRRCTPETAVGVGGAEGVFPGTRTRGTLSSRVISASDQPRPMAWRIFRSSTSSHVMQGRRNRHAMRSLHAVKVSGAAATGGVEKRTQRAPRSAPTHCGSTRKAPCEGETFPTICSLTAKSLLLALHGSFSSLRPGILGREGR